ncbi:MAG: T9SS type A sorting domain-containing protein [Bacteroidetes bacterium]|nr:T9SS type A sorting domain-containing protein [Bacteroidota bacterium]
MNSYNAKSQCIPTVGFTGATGDYVNNFSFGTLSNLGSGDDPNDYTLFSNTASYVQGLSYTYTIQAGSAVFTQSIGIWIDLNGNTLFSDPGEFVYVSPSTVTSATTLTGSITIPISTSPGIKRMRVCAKYFTALTATESCGITTFGEYEDYNITILANTPCTGTPVAGTSSATAINPCPGVNVCFTLTGSSLTGGLAYQWLQGSNCAAPWIPIPGATNPSALTPNLCVSAVAGTTIGYRCRVTCTNTGLSDTSTSTCIVVQPWSCTSPCYGASAATNAPDQDIFNVTVGSLNNTTGCATPLVGSQGTGTGTASMYADFSTGVPAPAVYKGLSTPFDITVGTCGGAVASSVKMYIDFNHNASFSDPGEEVYSTVSVTPPITLSGTFITPASALLGCTKMRVVMMSTWIGTVNPTGTYAYGETEDYSLNIIQPSPYDPAISAITVPAGTCFTNNETVTATLSNYGSAILNLVTNPVTVTLNVTGPTGVIPYTAIASTGTLSPYGVNSTTLTFNGVDLYPGGSYALNTTLVLSGLINGNLINDSLAVPIARANYRPTPGPDYPICQGSIIPFGQGLTVSGCATPVLDSATITFTIAPGQPPICPNTSTTYLGSCLFASGILPTLPPSPTFIGNAKLTVTNLYTLPTCPGCTYAQEQRFSLFKGNTVPVPAANFFIPGGVGHPGTSVPLGFTYTNDGLTASTGAGVNALTPTKMGDIYNQIGAGGTLNIGQWDTWSTPTTVNINVGTSTTVAQLKFYYTYVPASFEWYAAPTGGPVLFTYSPFNPIGVPGTGLINTNTPGTTPFYAACAGSSDCRVPVDLVINPVPLVFQDTIVSCEYAVGSNSAICNLPANDGPISAYASGVSVSYFGDQALFVPIINPTNDTTSSGVLYSKVTDNLTGCFASDSVLVDVHSIPQFSLPIYIGNACAPNAIDISSLISIFPTTNIDTLFFEDAAYTIPYSGNPHFISTPDSLYMIVNTTGGIVVCSDSSIADIQVLPATNNIANQDIFANYSVPGVIPCGNLQLSDGNTETLYTTTDCRKIATITDAVDLNNLGTVTICEEIASSVPDHNGQPYVNRSYQITPTNNDSAVVCLYYLDDDFAQYSLSAAFLYSPAWPTMSPTTNLCISKVDNGDLNTPGHTAVSIPNADITATYDPSTTVWTVCFPVSSFSYFYCHTCNPLNIALPVNLLNFTGKRVNGQSELHWVTATEINNSHFVVERSKDAKSFSELSSKIPTKAIGGNSSNNLSYNYNDVKPFNGHNYYRLRQVDIDGNTSYSQVVDVYYGNDAQVTIFPNPVNTELNIEVNTEDQSLVFIKINDATGRVVRIVEMNTASGATQTTIDMSDLADGVYMVHVSNKNGLNFSQTIRKN